MAGVPVATVPPPIVLVDDDEPPPKPTFPVLTPAEKAEAEAWKEFVKREQRPYAKTQRTFEVEESLFLANSRRQANERAQTNEVLRQNDYSVATTTARDLEAAVKAQKLVEAYRSMS